MSLIPYYTGAAKYNDKQLSPSKSIGGPVSSSSIVDCGIDNLFSMLSQNEILKGIEQYRVIAFKNETGNNITGTVQVYYENENAEDSIFNLAIAIAQLSADNCGDYITTQAVNSNTGIPNIDYINAKGVDNALEITTGVATSQYIGVFIKLGINKKNLKKKLGDACFGGKLGDECTAMFQQSLIENINQVYKIIFTPDVAGSLFGQYWTLDTEESKYYIWYTDGTSTDPKIEGRKSVKVTIASGDTDIQIAQKTYNQLEILIEESGEVELALLNNEITITNNCPGTTDYNVDLIPFTSALITKGSTSIIKQIESLKIIIDY